MSAFWGGFLGAIVAGIMLFLFACFALNDD